MTGKTIQTLMRELDPSLRFMVPMATTHLYMLSTAEHLAGMERIGDADNAAIYASYTDLDGSVCIGIAQDEASDIDASVWLAEQLARPVLRSYDRVDILGQVIRDLTESDLADPTEDTP